MLAAVALAGSVLVATANTAAATGLPCVSPRGNWFDGYGSTQPGPAPGGTYEGVEALLAFRRGELCDDDTDPNWNFNTSWVMVAANAAQGSNRGYAQVGYFRAYGEVGNYFTEYKKNAAEPHHRARFPGPSYGEVHRMRVVYQAPALWFNIDGVSYGPTPFDPYATDAFWPFGYGPMETQLSSEATHTGSDVPGAFTSPTTWEQIIVQTWNGHAWTTTLPAYGNITPTSTRWTKTPFYTCCRSFSAWTI